MRRILVTILIVCTSGLMLMAAVPNWSVNPANYSGSMVMVGVITVDGEESVDENNMVAAFIGPEVRGVANLKYEAAVDRYFAYLIIYGNTSGGTLTFKIYDADQDLEIDAIATATFQVNAAEGNVASPFIWSNTSQSNASEMLSFTFPESIGGEVIGADAINVTVPYTTDVTGLLADFTVSNLASVKVNGLAQVSGVTVNDFSAPVVYRVIAENGVDFTEYSLEVGLTENPVPTDIMASFTNTDENNALGAAIVTLEAVDDAADSHNFSLVSGVGDAHNSSFDIVDNQLVARAVFDYETRSEYSVRIQASDSYDQTIEKAVTVLVNDVNEVPTLSNVSFNVEENSVIGTEVGVMSGVDPDGDALIYSLTGGNGTFAVNSSTGAITVSNSTSLNFEANPQFILTITAADGNLSASATLVINLIDVDDNVLGIGHEVDLKIYPNPAVGFVHIQSNENIRSVACYNIHGKKVFQSEGSRLDVSELPSGFYLLHVHLSERVEVLKFLKR